MAQRWLNLGFTQFQPSDLTKILMILFFAKFLMEREQKIKEPKTIIQAIALILPSLALIYKQPNLFTTICIAALFAVLLYLGGLSYKLIGTVLVIHNTDDHYTACCCNTAKPAVLKRLSAGTYPCMAGT